MQSELQVKADLKANAEFARTRVANSMARQSVIFGPVHVILSFMLSSDSSYLLPATVARSFALQRYRVSSKHGRHKYEAHR
jgi:hypothetical protein